MEMPSQTQSMQVQLSFYVGAFEVFHPFLLHIEAENTFYCANRKIDSFKKHRVYNDRLKVDKY